MEMVDILFKKNENLQGPALNDWQWRLMKTLKNGNI